MQDRLAARGRDLEPAPPGLFSILTCIYERSPADLFRETAASVLGQQSRDFEWIVVAQGTMRDDLWGVLRETAEDRRVHCLLRPNNSGIVRGLRSALEAASGTYALPLDGDDRLYPDALSVLSAAIERGGHPPFLYGDEDALVDGAPAAPYFRPDWDPLLNLATSYIWHPSVFDRRRALELGVFEDEGAEYCQDWDTVFRFWTAGVQPVHVPEVLYHWTAHAGSSTHRAEPHHGSLDSQRNVLQRVLAERELVGDFELDVFPLDRGLPELWPRRARRDAPEVRVVCFERHGREVTRLLTRIAQTCDYPVGDLVPVRGVGVADLRRAVDARSGGWTVVVTPDAVPEGADWLWETVALGELVPDVGFVSGRIVDRRDVVEGGGELWGAGDPVGCPDRGHGALDPGPYAISLKPHSVSAVDPRFFAARSAVLSEALADVADDADLRWLGVWLGAWAGCHGVRTAYSPLVSARCRRAAAAPGPMSEEERRSIVRRFGSLPGPHPLVRLYALTGGRGGTVAGG